MAQKEISGIIASPGIRIGKAYIYKGVNIVIPKYKISKEEINFEKTRLQNAVNKTKQEIMAIQQQVANSLSSDMADIFSSHLMVLEDPAIITKAIDSINSEMRNVEWILNDISLELIKSLDSIDDVYLRERIIDISDIHKRLIKNLQKIEHESLADLKEDVIIFAEDLTPSDTAVMNRDHALAFVTNKGGRTSHTAILARALEIPAIVGTIKGTSSIKNGDSVIVDGVRGKVLINPSNEEVISYISHQQDLLLLERELSKLTHLPAKTINDVEIGILGNIELPEEMAVIKDHGADSIGLFRSEFLFLDKSLPDEETQLEGYRKVVEYFSPQPVTIRTIDVGGDKIFGANEDYRERNPFLGCRAIRFSIANENLFVTQLRAILRSSVYGNVKIMFPMITTLDEIFIAKDIIEQVKYELQQEGLPFAENVPIGIMIEVPSAALNIDVLGKYVDFFSIGTNDLVQYTLAVDRIGEKVAYLYNPLDPAILRLLKSVTRQAAITGKDLSICGEIAGEPRYTMVLLGLGFRNLSMSSAYMYQVKRVIRSVTIEECEALVEKLMSIESASEMTSYHETFITTKFPFLFSC
ncbi:MAG: phosphoenolpyruvate--protein phosphotransferase [Spirochaetes bacterium]|nr:phosphoenolpyruvate--protein phosphotransferase [Spirochaetota bacterium]